LISPKEAAEYLRISEATVLRYINAEVNPLPCYKISKKTIRIKKEALDNWIMETFNKGGEQK